MTYNIGKEPVDITVAEKADGLRVDSYLGGIEPQISRSQIQKMIRDGLITVNGVICKAKEHIRVGDTIHISVPKVVKPTPHVDVSEYPEYHLDIIYEDDSILVVNKQAGLVVHEGAGESGPTLVDFLKKHTPNLSSIAGEDRHGIVHRLDKDTTGVLVCAKNDKSHEHLANQFKEKTNFREYIALLNGVISQPTISHSSYLGRDPKRRVMMKAWTDEEYASLEEGQREGLRTSVSHFKLIKTFFERLSLVSVQLETGRTHQIRVHAHHLGCGVWGDPLYRSNPKLPDSLDADIRKLLSSIKRQLLHAKYLGFVHPETGEKLAFEAPLPDDFSQVLDEIDRVRLNV